MEVIRFNMLRAKARKRNGLPAAADEDFSELEQCRNDSGCSRVVCYVLVFRRRACSSAVRAGDS